MKKTSLSIWRQTGGLLLLIGISTLVAAQTPQAGGQPPSTAVGADPPPPPTPEQASYLFGLVFGSQVHSTGVTTEVVLDAINRGFNDGLQGKQPTPADQQQLRAYIKVVSDAVVARNETAAKDFLRHNAREKGVITTASGLQYKILAAGDAKAKPIVASDRVTVDYRGKLIDGSEFDSSYSRGVPATFPVGGVIKGWQEALVLMKPGAKWELFVPPDLAYGSSPRPKIPPGSLLIFEVNVLSAESSAPPAAAVPRTITPSVKAQAPAGTPKALDQ
ncbi:MAG TPA: FKBP-type peptidyl-prolyl cis-trans isomerase [Steroidobacteraceae bacterium]